MFSCVKDTHAEKTPSNKSEALTKYENVYLDNWYIKSAIYKRFLNSN